MTKQLDVGVIYITGSIYFVKMSQFSVYSSTVQIVVETGLSYIIAHLINDVIMVKVRC